MHLQSGHMHQEPRADELIMQLMVTKHVTHVLTKKAFDTLPKLLNTVHIALVHSPGPVLSIRWSGFESLNLFLDLEIPGYVGDQILD
jgi:hypothetical protein